jgi:aspartate aminotransferase-like enzyme
MSVGSILEPGDKVLCLTNGHYGDGFADFVELYDGIPVMYEVDYGTPFHLDAVKPLVSNHDFTAATMVHCETPIGVLNDLTEILSYLQSENILTIVDAVSSLGGTPVPVESIDLCIGASQKCFSSPPGLTTLSVSDRAWTTIESTPQRSYYASIEPWKTHWIEDEWFPYTHLVSNLYALDESLDIILEEGLESVFDRHKTVADYCRSRGKDMGLEPFSTTDELCSPTVTAFSTDTDALTLQNHLRKHHDITLATSLVCHDSRILRVGRVAYNATMDRVQQTMDALETTITS